MNGEHSKPTEARTEKQNNATLARTVAKELFDIAQHERMPQKVNKKLVELANRLQGVLPDGLVKFADGTHGCRYCGARPSIDGAIVHDESFPHA